MPLSRNIPAATLIALLGTLSPPASAVTVSHISGNGEEQEVGPDAGFDQTAEINWGDASHGPFSNSGLLNGDNGQAAYFASVDAKTLKVRAEAFRNTQESLHMFAGATASFSDRISVRFRNQPEGPPILLEDGFLRLHTIYGGTLTDGANGSLQVSVFGLINSTTVVITTFDPVHNLLEFIAAIGDISEPVSQAQDFGVTWTLDATADTSPNFLSSRADLSSTAEIINIDYLRPDGTLEPDYIVVGESGLVYTSVVPEPSTYMLAMVALVAIAITLLTRWRSRRSPHDVAHATSHFTRSPV